MSDNSITIYGNVSDTQIQQGSINSSQTQKQLSENDIEKFQGILDQINKYRLQFPTEFGDKSDELIAALDRAQEALEAKSQPLWKKAISTVHDLAIGINGSLIASGILNLLQKV